jgi:site-specific recombinase XerD
MKKLKTSNCPIPNFGLSAANESINRFEVHLEKRGHTNLTKLSYLSSARHFYSWLEIRNLAKIKINKKLVQEFLYEHLPICCCPEPVYKDLKTVRASLNQLLLMEGYDRIKTIMEPAMRNIEVEVEIDIFDKYLKNVCGYAEATRWYHRRHIREFLLWLFGDYPICADKIKAEQLCRFVSEKAGNIRSSSIGVVVYSLRTYLRFLQLNGHVTPSLKATIPRPPNWSGASLPHSLTCDELSRFWSAFDRKTPLGKRNYAIARCLADVGLRCCEVAAIQLEDIDWYNQILHLPNRKSRRKEILPIPDKMGRALTSYLRYGRPKTKSRFVFVYHCAPIGQAVKGTTVRGVIRRAFSYAGVSWTGTHILRSTTASRLLEGGASLKEIAEVLRHRSIETTKFYTKIDFVHLAQVALPWPRRSS